MSFEHVIDNWKTAVENLNTSIRTSTESNAQQITSTLLTTANEIKSSSSTMKTSIDLVSEAITAMRDTLPEQQQQLLHQPGTNITRSDADNVLKAFATQLGEIVELHSQAYEKAVLRVSEVVSSQSNAAETTPSTTLPVPNTTSVLDHFATTHNSLQKYESLAVENAELVRQVRELKIQNEALLMQQKLQSNPIHTQSRQPNEGDAFRSSDGAAALASSHAQEISKYENRIQMLDSELKRFQSTAQEMEEQLYALKKDAQALTFENALLRNQLNLAPSSSKQQQQQPLRNSDLQIFGDFVIPAINVVRSVDEVDTSSFTFRSTRELMERYYEVSRELFRITQNTRADQSTLHHPLQQQSSFVVKKRVRDDEDDDGEATRKSDIHLAAPPRASKYTHHPEKSTQDVCVQVLIVTDEDNNKCDRRTYLDALTLSNTTAEYCRTLTLAYQQLTDAPQQPSSDKEEWNAVTTELFQVITNLIQRGAAEAAAHDKVRKELHETQIALESKVAKEYDRIQQDVQQAHDVLMKLVQENVRIAGHVTEQLSEEKKLHAELLKEAHGQQTATTSALKVWGDLTASWTQMSDSLRSQYQSIQDRSLYEKDNSQALFTIQGLKEENEKLQSRLQTLQHKLDAERLDFASSMESSWQAQEKALIAQGEKQQLQSKLESCVPKEEVSKIEFENAELRQQLTTSQEQHQACEAELKEIKEKLNTLQNTVTQAEAEIARLRVIEQSYQDTLPVFETTRSRLVQVEETSSKWETQYGEQSRASQTLQQRCNELQALVENLQSKMVDDAVRSGFFTETDVVSNLNSRVMKLTQELSEAAGRIAMLDRVQSENQELKTTLETTRREKALVQTQLLTQSNRANRLIEQRVLDLEKQNSATSAALQKSQHAEKVATARVTHLETAIAGLEKLLDNYKEKLSILSNKEEASALKECGLTLAQYLRQETAKAKSDLTNAQQQLQALAHRETSLQQTINKLSEEKRFMQSRMDQMQGQEHHLQGNLGALNEQLMMRNMMTQHMEAQIQQLMQENGNLKRELDSLRKMGGSFGVPK
eukprot:PhF_6_TR31789/c0_g1_i2/m.46825